MNIDLLRLTSLRCFEDVTLTPGPAANWLVGDNGSGKTTLLEAAYILSHGRSFRAGGRSTPCRQGTPEYAVYAEISRSAKRRHRLGLIRREDGWQARLDGNDLATLAPVFEVCPVVCFGPETSALITGPADERRGFLDWSVFHVEHQSLELWRKWRRTLRQRNVLLRMTAEDAAFEPWEHELAELAGRIHRMRSDCLASLEPYMTRVAAWLVPELGWAKIEYRPGWDERVGLGTELARQRPRDRERGFTQRGAHRADWTLVFESISRREYLSRGQAKTIALVCTLAQTQWLKDRLGEYPLLCIDDLDSELDPGHVAKAVGWIAAEPIQSWLTSTTRPAPARLSPGTRMFHVEQAGSVPPSSRLRQETKV